jgi:hypothetical protein
MNRRKNKTDQLDLRFAEGKSASPSVQMQSDDATQARKACASERVATKIVVE